MRKGILIRRGAIIDNTPGERWSIALPLEASVLEVAALMSAFGLYCELEDGARELRLVPADFRPPPDAAAIGRFYSGEPRIIPERIRFIGVDWAAGGFHGGT